MRTARKLSRRAKGKGQIRFARWLHSFLLSKKGAGMIFSIDKPMSFHKVLYQRRAKRRQKEEQRRAKKRTGTKLS